MSLNHKVWVEGSAYRIKGDFHEIEMNQPIRREDKKLCGVTNPRHIVHIHSYGGEAAFFEGLAQGKLLGTKCKNGKCGGNGSVYLPFRIACPDCLQKMAVIDLTQKAQKARIYSFIVTARTGAFNTLDKPIRFIDIEIPGVCTMLKSYMLCGEPEIGLKVVPIFKKKPTYTITDLAWVPKKTKEKDLPKGFTF